MIALIQSILTRDPLARIIIAGDFNHLLDQGIVEPTRGSYLLSFSPSAEYRLNQRLSLRIFFDYRYNEPKTSAGFPRTDASGGIVVRFSL